MTDPFTAAFVCLAMNIYHEARGQSIPAQVAVAHVVMNRVEDRHFPDEVCDVVKEGGERLYRCQFSWYCDGRPDRPADARAWAVAETVAWWVMEGTSVDPTGGATHYHAHYVQPHWPRLEVVHEDDGHKFYRRKR